MKLPADLNPVVTERVLAGGTPVWDITVTFNEEDHTYTVAELNDFTSVQILLKAMDDGYGATWNTVSDNTVPAPVPFVDSADKVDSQPLEVVDGVPSKAPAKAQKTE